MSLDFYFNKWKLLLTRLKMLIELDIEYQTEKTHDQELSDAVLRVVTILVQYMKIYNEIIECVQNNLQVQKTVFMNNIVNGIASRILEMKHNLEEIEGSPFQYISTGLIMNQDIYDPEMSTVLKVKRTPMVEEAIETAFQRAKEKREAPEEPEVEEEEEEHKALDDLHMKLEEMLKMMTNLGEQVEQVASVHEVEEIKLSDEGSLRLEHLNRIKAHEKLRQVTRFRKLSKLKREAWEKELLGTAAPLARYELRQKAARLIQKVIRAYFEIKREHIKICKRDQILGLAICKEPTMEKRVKVVQKPRNYTELYDKYERECAAHITTSAEQYMNRRGYIVSGEFRDRIREWFHEWFLSIRYIHDLPKDGSIAIFKEEVPDPYEWIEQYQEHLKKAKMAKNTEELKREKKEAKELERKAKLLEIKYKKDEAALLKKMMKSPKLHPGYQYKESKNTNSLLELVNDYHNSWDQYDAKETLEVKCKFINEINIQEAYMNVNLTILEEINEDMKTQCLALKTALQKDYNTIGEVMPVDFDKTKRRKKKNKLKAVNSERIVDKLEILAFQGFVVKYPETKLGDYLGDPNFSGEDYRRLILQTYPQGYEIRSYWWNLSHKVSKGFQKILLAGPKGSGKTTLVYALATMNDAVLYELDPVNMPAELLNKSNLIELTKKVLYCAKATEPSVIYIRNIQKLFYNKIPREEENLQLGLIKRYFVKKLLIKLKKIDKVTIIGACSDPWLAKTRELLKPFTNVVLMPGLSYSLTEILFKNWINRYLFIPYTNELAKLAYILSKLQNYSYGYLQRTLDEFMSDDRYIRVAVRGLDVMELYDYILENEPKEKIDYERYRKWYFEKTPPGKKERAHFNSRLEYKKAEEDFKAKEEAKLKQAKRSAPNSAKSSATAL